MDSVCLAVEFIDSLIHFIDNGGMMLKKMMGPEKFEKNPGDSCEDGTGRHFALLLVETAEVVSGIHNAD